MRTEKAITLNDFFNDALTLFYNLLEDREYENYSKQLKKEDLSETMFTKLYADFEAELEENILEYKDLDVIYDYIKTCLNEFNVWVGFDENTNSYIIRQGNEVTLLLKTKQQIDYYKLKIAKLLDNSYSWKSEALRQIYYKITEPENENVEYIESLPDESYIFDKMLAEITLQQLTTLKAIGFINDRLYDFKQWQLAYDTQIDYEFWGTDKKFTHQYSDEHYPNFEKLCGLEIAKLEKRNKLERDELTQKAIEKNPIVIEKSVQSDYEWKSTDTDLLELLAALYQIKSIARRDGKPLSRKELIEYFQLLFGMEIKDIEGKLSKAGNRNDNTPFLMQLEQQFRNYVREKMLKQKNR